MSGSKNQKKKDAITNWYCSSDNAFITYSTPRYIDQDWKVQSELLNLVTMPDVRASAIVAAIKGDAPRKKVHLST